MNYNDPYPTAGDEPEQTPTNDDMIPPYSPEDVKVMQGAVDLGLVGNPNEQTPAWIIFNTVMFYLRCAMVTSLLAFIGYGTGYTLVSILGWHR